MNRTGTKLVLGLSFMLSAMNHTSQIQVESHLFNYFKYSFLKLGIFSISRLCIAVPQMSLHKPVWCSWGLLSAVCSDR